MKINEIFKKEGFKESVIGIAIVAIVIIIVAVIATSARNKEANKKNLKDVYVATGGGKEDFLADSDVVRIMEDKYKLKDLLENGLKTVQGPSKAATELLSFLVTK